MWKAIKGFEGIYEVSDRGEIRSLDRTLHFKYKDRFYKGAIKRQQTGTNGYKIVKLYKGDKKRYTFSVHRLVAEAFLEKPSYAECINHKDGNRTNNNVNNLEWCTYSYNNYDIYKRNPNCRKGIKIPSRRKVVAMYNKDSLVAIKECSRDMAIYLKENYQIKSNIETIARSIREVCSTKRKSAYGYKFSYLKDYS